jgi:DNA-directed RNA polymerase specialized sigma24 family protein
MFALRYVEGFSNREIGAMLGTSESVVGVTLHRARAQVRDALGAELDSHLTTQAHESDKTDADKTDNGGTP